MYTHCILSYDCISYFLCHIFRVFCFAFMFFMSVNRNLSRKSRRYIYYLVKVMYVLIITVVIITYVVVFENIDVITRHC